MSTLPKVTKDFNFTNLNGYCSKQGQCNAVNPAIHLVEGGDAVVAVHRVIDTDYDTYSINYDCGADSGYPRLWILSRDQELSDAEYKKIYSRMTKLLPNFNANLYMKDRITQHGCDYRQSSWTPSEDSDSSDDE